MNYLEAINYFSGVMRNYIKNRIDNIIFIS